MRENRTNLRELLRDLEEVAHHEAGHALVARKLGLQAYPELFLKMSKVTNPKSCRKSHYVSGQTNYYGLLGKFEGCVLGWAGPLGQVRARIKFIGGSGGTIFGSVAETHEAMWSFYAELGSLLFATDDKLRGSDLVSIGLLGRGAECRAAFDRAAEIITSNTEELQQIASQLVAKFTDDHGKWLASHGLDVRQAGCDKIDPSPSANPK